LFSICRRWSESGLITDAVVADPVGAVRQQPTAVELIVGTMLTTVLLVGLIVGFGARYAVADPERRD